MSLGSRSNQHSFSVVPAPSIPRSSFDRSFTVKDTMEFDYLNPIFVEEIIPGDTVSLNLNTFVRLATQKVPILDNLYVDYYFFFCPSRLLWANWKKFMGEQDNPSDSISYTIPQMVIPAGGPEVGSLADKFGLPTDVAAGYQANALPFRMYNKVWNEWFRDQNLQNSVVVDTDDGTDALSDYVLLKANKKHDYFTSCLPSPQKGTAVELPLGTNAPIYSAGLTHVDNTIPIKVQYEDRAWGELSANGASVNNSSTAGTTTGYLYADLSAATAATINSLRQAFAIQQILELDARSGTRYVEALKGRWGVTSPDFRLQRPEYLGGGSTAVTVNPIAQTSGSNASGTSTPLANLAAVGTALAKGHGFTQSFTEHGVIIGLVSVRADLIYQQGLDRM